ncbi:UPF0301 protein J3U87_20435 [Sulfidibacter corallicola]|uniref:UPF0301 protein J3U87_20435 n=1 Tax=Sulfidibacter corallicola TaxID=2818388 RepID=A0A8A4TGP4_SULCO|nr:YqgE/AlgH family protein [Sulfidibacter corallicola]QTD47961.1 YqgE/AlgH family protein [Sulfidibacter corallicola]
MIQEIQTPSLLVAMPNLRDPYFQKTVVLLCDYTQESAFGVVINRPSPVKVKDIIADQHVLRSDVNTPILVGGPVQPEFLWAVHSPDFVGKSTTEMDFRIHMSSILEVLNALAEGHGPTTYHLGCGYAGWGPGQLSNEIKEGAWWLTPVDIDLVLKMPYTRRWEAVLANIGINPETTSFFQTGEA